MATPGARVAVIGAGPVGLAAAAHLVERGLTPVVLEAASDVAASPRAWGHVRLFSPWRYNVDAAAARLLAQAGWSAPPPEGLPTGDELFAAYLRPLANLPQIRAHLRLGRRVTAISRLALDKVRTRDRAQAPFLIRTTGPDGDEELTADALIDASGTWANPNPLGASGLPAHGESDVADRIQYGLPDVLGRDRARYEGRTTLVVGAGHSAANSLISLAELARAAPTTKIVWATRGSNLARVFGGGELDQLPARGRIGEDLRRLIDDGRLTMVTSFAIEGLAATSKRLRITGRRHGEPFVLDDVDAIIAATGQRPELGVLRELRLALDPALESAAALGPLIDPNEHSCGTVRPHGAQQLAHPEPGFYVIGSKSYGRAPTFLLATGYEQARSVVAMLAGDEAAAARVELDLPETGVCSSNLGGDADSACCAPEPAAAPEAAQTEACGCSEPAPAPGGCC